MTADKGSNGKRPLYEKQLAKALVRSDAIVEKVGKSRGFIYQLVIYVEKRGETIRDVLTAVSEELMPILARNKDPDWMQQQLVTFWQDEQE